MSVVKVKRGFAPFTSGNTHQHRCSRCKRIIVCERDYCAPPRKTRGSPCLPCQAQALRR